jgi:hypothetical protein
MTSATEQTGAAVRRFAAGIMAADGPRVTARSAGRTAGPAGNRTGLWPAGVELSQRHLPRRPGDLVG